MTVRGAKFSCPHDYIVEGEYSSKADTGHGSLPVFPAWYRRKFSVAAADQDKCVWLYFEGVFRNAKIYVNGKLVGRHPGGYTSFHVDIADAVNFGAENLLAVYVDPTDFEGWWYEGGGIYRHVWLNVADKVHVAPWGVYVTSEVTDVTGSPSAKLHIETLVANRTTDTQNCSVVSTVLDPDGHVVGTATDSLVGAVLSHSGQCPRNDPLLRQRGSAQLPAQRNPIGAGGQSDFRAALVAGRAEPLHRGDGGFARWQGRGPSHAKVRHSDAAVRSQRRLFPE